MSFKYHKPSSLGEALGLLGIEGGKSPVLAGGTDLIAGWRTGSISPEGFIDISKLDELKAINVDMEESAIEVGALVTHAQICAHEDIRGKLPALAAACSMVGGKQIQNMGTIGGNVMNASPAGDTPPVLAVHDAEFVLKNLKGERTVHVDDFFPGYRKTALKQDELLTSIRIPISDDPYISRFYKIGTRRAQAISKVSMCVRGKVAHGGIERLKIAFGSVAPTVMRALGTEALLAGKVITSGLIDKARRSLADELSPIDDVRSTSDYRKYAAVGLLLRFLREVTKDS